MPSTANTQGPTVKLSASIYDHHERLLARLTGSGNITRSELVRIALDLLQRELRVRSAEDLLLSPAEAVRGPEAVPA